MCTFRTSCVIHAFCESEFWYGGCLHVVISGSTRLIGGGGGGGGGGIPDVGGGATKSVLKFVL